MHQNLKLDNGMNILLASATPTLPAQPRRTTPADTAGLRPWQTAPLPAEGTLWMRGPQLGTAATGSGTNGSGSQGRLLRRENLAAWEA